MPDGPLSSPDATVTFDVSPTPASDGGFATSFGDGGFATSFGDGGFATSFGDGGFATSFGDGGFATSFGDSVIDQFAVGSDGSAFSNPSAGGTDASTSGPAEPSAAPSDMGAHRHLCHRFIQQQPFLAIWRRRRLRNGETKDLFACSFPEEFSTAVANDAFAKQLRASRKLNADSASCGLSSIPCDQPQATSIGAHELSVPSGADRFGLTFGSAGVDSDESAGGLNQAASRASFETFHRKRKRRLRLLRTPLRRVKPLPRSQVVTARRRSARPCLR